MQQRLQKLLAQTGLASRREAEKWIESGRVMLNGAVASIGMSADPAVDEIVVDGRPLPRAEQHRYLMLNKPVGYVTTMSDPEGRQTVRELVTALPERLYPVGRLDLTTEGLLLLTNDGDFAQQLAHPRHQIDKTYLVRVRGKVDYAMLRQLEVGVMLEDGMTAPARIGGVRSTGSHGWFNLTLREGRNRQVRRMCEAVGFPVSRLKRTNYAFLTLGDLAEGQWRELTRDEVARLKKLAYRA
ncbi:MAG: rRNA pseudouridine synthase [Desulfuromonadaceae bacterium]|nr:rRNA pseudouridine synthase [Desulfuromonadaceae bacterium]